METTEVKATNKLDSDDLYKWIMESPGWKDFNKNIREEIAVSVDTYLEPSDSGRTNAINEACEIYNLTIGIPDKISLKQARLGIQKLQSQTQSLRDTLSTLSYDCLTVIIQPVKGDENFRLFVADFLDRCERLDTGCQAILDARPVTKGGAPDNIRKQVCAELTVQLFQRHRPSALNDSVPDLVELAENIYKLCGVDGAKTMVRAIPDAIKRLAKIQKPQ
jgi:hypothetical protein